MYTHSEYLWIHAGTDIDFYDLTDKSTYDEGGNPTLAYALDSGSSCIVSDTFIIGDDAFSYHGDEPYCTCNWRADKPCPSQLSIQVGSGAPQLVTLGINNIVSVDTVSPDVEGSVAIASDGTEKPTEACFPLINADEIAGKWCLTDRGGCFFNTKYLNCMAAGAIAAIVVNRDSSVITMQVTDVEPDTIHIMIGADSGQIIKDALAAGQDVTLKAGQGTGPPAPLPEYSSPDPLGVINMFTGKRDLEDSPFILADEIDIDYKNKLMYAFSVDGNIPESHVVMNYSTVEDGTYPVLGVFTFGEQYDGSSRQIFYQGDRTYIMQSTVWKGLASIWDITDDPVNPVFVSEIFAEPSCPEEEGGTVGYGGTQMHPSGDYVYLVDVYDQACGAARLSDDDLTVVRIVDISDPANPKILDDFTMYEVEGGALTLNGATWEFGPNGLTGISMTSSGFVLYDFSDPENPVPASEVYDPAENSNDFTKGVFNSRYGDDGFWYVYEKDGVDGVHGEWHQLKAVPCNMPFACQAYV